MGNLVRTAEASAFPAAVVRDFKVRRWPETNEEIIPLRCFKGLNTPRCQHVYVAGEDRAGVWLVGRGVQSKIAALQERFPSIRFEQDGDREATFTLPMSDLHALLDEVGAPRRRRLSERQRKRCADRLAEFRFKPRTHVSDANDAQNRRFPSGADRGSGQSKTGHRTGTLPRGAT